MTGSIDAFVLVTRLVCFSTVLGFLAGSIFLVFSFRIGSLTGSGTGTLSGGSAMLGSGTGISGKGAVRTEMGIWTKVIGSAGFGFRGIKLAQDIANAAASASKWSDRLTLSPKRFVLSKVIREPYEPPMKGLAMSLGSG